VSVAGGTLSLIRRATLLGTEVLDAAASADTQRSRRQHKCAAHRVAHHTLTVLRRTGRPRPPGSALSLTERSPDGASEEEHQQEGREDFEERA